MDTKIRCSECEATLRVSEKHLGRTVRCPRCGSPVKIPHPEPDDLIDSNLDLSEDEVAPETSRRSVQRQQPSRTSVSAKRGRPAKKQSNSSLMIGLAAGAGMAVIAISLIFWFSSRPGRTDRINSNEVASTPVKMPEPSVAAPASTEISTPVVTQPSPAATVPPQSVVSSASKEDAAAPSTPAVAVRTVPESAGTNDLSVLTERVGRGLVLIRVKDANGNVLGLGSGFIINREGLVATNFHVMDEAITAEAEFRDGGRVQITGYRAFDEKRDIAIVQLESVPADAEPLELANNLDLKQGSSVIAMGHPRGLRFTATEGIVSAIHKTSELPPDLRRHMECPDDQVWIQTSATIFSGNSGGPLLSRAGKVIGINSWITRDVNFGFALGIQHLIDLMSQVKDSPLSLDEVNRQGRSEKTPLNLGELDPKVKAIQEEFQRSFEELQVLLSVAKTREEQQRILNSKNPARRDVPKLIKVAHDNAKTPCAYQALIFSLALLRQYSPESTATSAMQQVTNQLLRDHLTEKSMVTAALLVSNSELTCAKGFLSELVKKSPERDVKGVACFLARALIAADKSGPRKEGVKLLERIVNEFSDVMIRDTPIVDEAQKLLFAQLHLTVGTEAPEIEGENADGEAFKLSDFRGKVVMLDFFANWCPHCTKMYPLERIIVDRAANEPCVLLGVNCDKPGVLQQVIKEKKVTWQCWADGESGPIATEWQLSGYPLIYLIDHEGIIRYRFEGAPDAKKIEVALTQLVVKAKSGKSKSGTKRP